MLFKKLHTLHEEDFVIMRTSFESGRLTPKRVTGGLFFGIIIQLVYGLGLFAVADPFMRTGYYKLTLLMTQYSFTLLLIILALVFMIPSVYIKRQYVQLIVSNLALANYICIFSLYAALFMLVRTVVITEKSFFSLGIIVIITGIATYFATLFRLVRSLEAGNYRKDGGKFNYDKVLERDRKIVTKLPEIIIVATGLIFIIQFLLANMFTEDVEMMIFVFLFFSLVYMGALLIAYSTIGIYCKWRFTSFNFDENGELHPLGSRDRMNN